MRVQVPQYHRATALPPQQLSLCLSEGEDTCTGGCEAETQGGVRRATPETDICVPLAGGVLGGHQTWKHCHRPRRLAQRGLGKLMQSSLQSRRAEREMLGGSTEGLPASCPCPQGAVHPQQDQARGSGSKLLAPPSCAPASASLPVSAGSKLGLLGGLRGGGGWAGSRLLSAFLPQAEGDEKNWAPSELRERLQQSGRGALLRRSSLSQSQSPLLSSLVRRPESGPLRS